MYSALIRGRIIFLILAFAVSCCALYGAESSDPVRLSYAPGAYNSDILLSVEASTGYTLRYRFAGNDERLRDLPFNQALVLSALPGETRLYNLKLQIFKDAQLVEERSLSYQIDKTVPFSPEPVSPVLVSFQAMDVEFSPAPRDRDSHIYIRYRASDGSSAESNGEPRIHLEGKKGALLSYELTVYAEDAAHNQSPQRTWTYSVDRRKEIDVSTIPVLSPVEGTFQNPQYLYIDSQSFSELRYTSDGSDPKKGTLYTGGTVLQTTGRVTIRIWGKTRAGQELEKSVVYEAGTERLDGIESDILYDTKVLQRAGETWYYAAGEKTPSVYDPTLSDPLRITPQTGTLRGLALRLLREKDHAVFRYYFVLDGRVPTIPELWVRAKSALINAPVTLSPGSYASGDIQLQGQAADGLRIWYRLDGKPNDSNDGLSKELTGTQTISIADLAKSADTNGICTIVAQTRAGPNSWSAPVRIPLTISAENPAPPAIQSQQNVDGTVTLSSAVNTGDVWYRVTSIFHSTESAGPFKLELPAHLSVPLGAAARFRYDFFVVNAATKVSAQTTPLSCDLSSLPPLEPVIRKGSDGLIQLVAPGTISYRITADRKDAGSLTGGFVLYSQPVALKPVAGENVLYTVEAYEKDASGSASTISRSSFPVHTRAPHGVRLVGGDAELYRNTLKSTVQIEAPEAGVEYHYSFGSPAAVKDPGPQSPWVASDIPIVSTESRARLELRICGISSYDRTLVGPISRFYVSIDTTLPGIPIVSGVEDGKSYRTPLSIQITSDSGSQIQYLLRNPGAAGDTPYVDYTQAVQVDAPQDTERDWELLVKARNKAGSETSLPRPIRFRVDTRTPALPIFMMSTEAGAARPAFGDSLSLVSRVDVEMHVDITPDVSVHYEISEDLTRIPKPDIQSPRYTGPLQFAVPSGQQKTWYFRYRAYDSAGNESPVSGVYTIVVDKKIPAVPAVPALHRQGNKGELIWQADPGVSIEVAIQAASNTDAALEYTDLKGGSFLWEIPEDQQSIVVYYRAIDSAGNTSESASILIERKKVAPQPVLNGVSAGGVYRDPIDIRTAGLLPGGQVHYELATGADTPQDVSAGSPQIGEFLEVGPIQGETIQYHLSVRQFADGYEASEPVRVDFTIDRTPPEPPRISNLDKQTVWFPDSNRVIFTTETGNSVRFALISEKIDYRADQTPLSEEKLESAFQDASYSVSQGPVELPAGGDNTVVRYLLSAYTVDPAGNRSLQTVYWQIFVDPLTVYVAEQQDSPSAAEPEQGSRSQPFHDIGNAIDYARDKGKKHIVVAAGKFGLSHPIAVSGLFIEGNRNPENWEISDTAQTIVYPQPTFSDTALFTVDSGQFFLEGIYLTDAGKALATLLSQKNAETHIVRSNLAISQSRTAVQSTHAALWIEHSTVSANDALNATLLELVDTDCSIESSVVESSDLPPVLQRNVSRSVQLMIDSQHSRLKIDESSLVPRRGLSTAALRIDGGTLSIASSSVSTGSGSQGALGIDAISNADIVITDSSLMGEIGAQTAIIVRLNTSKLSIKGSALKLDAALGVYGIYAQTANIVLNNDDIIAGQARDFITMILSEQSSLEVNGSRLKGATTSDFHVATMRGGTSVWKENSTSISGVQTGQSSALFSFSDMGQHQFENNNLVGNDLCTLFYAGSTDTQFVIRNNILERWQFILQESTPHPLRQSDLDQGITTIQQLEGLTRQGSLFEGNKVRQGL